MILRGDYMSDILHTTVNISFMIPEKRGDEPYKIAYLLHGLHGNSGTWINNTMLPYYGKDYDAIIAMPEVGRSFYCNQKYGRNYYTFISEELPQICKRIFNISEKREDTAVIGNSMGGYGALRMAFSKPGQYGFCGAISPACLYFGPIVDGLRKDPSAYLKTGREAEETLKDLYSIYGEELGYLPESDVPYLVKNYPTDIPKPKVYVNCGTEDNLLKENHKFREEMKGMSFDFTYEEWSGGHEWDFFNEGLKKTFEFWLKG